MYNVAMQKLHTGLFEIEHFHIEPSSLCQALCARCPRPVGMNKHQESGNISFDDYKEYISPYLNKKTVTLCGNYGDPMMNPEIAKIAIDMIESNNKTTITTNGGIGKEEDYYNLSLNNVRIIFNVEGMSQEVHEKYRNNVNFSILKRNVKAAHEGYKNRKIKNNESIIDFYVLPWSHTLKDLQDIIEYAKSVNANIIMGYPRHLVGGTPRFNKNGDIIEVITLPKNFSNFNYKTYFTDEFDQILNFNWGDDLPITNNTWYGHNKKESITVHVPYIKRKNTNYFNEYQKDVKINCSAEKEKSVFISCDLKLIPCCLLGTQITGEILKFRNNEHDEHVKTILDRYLEITDDIFNLKKKKLDDIVNSNEWREFAFNYVNGKKIVKYCEKICGLCN